MKRPFPPERLRRPGRSFEPSPRVAEWLRATFIAVGSPLENERYKDIRTAQIGVLWTNDENTRGQSMTLGTAEIPIPRQGAHWTKARLTYQLEQWFGQAPNFLITLYAPWCADARSDEWCALVEHELHHCGQAVNEYGTPRFHAHTGAPLWEIKPHDVEQFVGVAERYPAAALGENFLRLVEAAKGASNHTRRQIAGACGTCGAVAA